MSNYIKRSKTATSFKFEWLDELVVTATPKSHRNISIQLREVFHYDPGNGVLCFYCQDAKAASEFSTGKLWQSVWKLDFLKRHLTSKSHLDAVQKLRHNNASLPSTGLLRIFHETSEERVHKLDQAKRRRSNSEEVKILIDSVILAIKMNNSLLSVQTINEHMSKYVTIPESWRSKNYAFEFLDVINAVVQREIIEEIASAKFHTLTVDESTDISVCKRLILYFKYRPKDSCGYKSSFGGILTLRECNASAIVFVIREFYAKHNIDLQKMVMFTSDGASVMLGRHNGVAAQLKRDIPHLVQQHCVAHREDLGITDAWKEIKLIRDIETLIRTIYTMFSRSTTKRCKFQDIAEATEKQCVAFRPINEVRWLSRHFALQAIVKNYDALVEYFGGDRSNDPIARYCHEKLTNTDCKIALAVINDVMSELANLCKSLQRSCLTPVDALHLARGKINKLKQQYLAETVMWSESVTVLLSESCKENVVVNTQPLLNFINLVCQHLEQRFPEHEIEEWAAFDCDKLAECDFQFGCEDVKALCSKYSRILFCNIDSCVVLNQYNDFKFLVQEKVKSKLIASFADIVKFAFHNEDFAELSKLLDIGATFLASSADCERGFSLMNSLKTRLRNRLEEFHLDMLMRVKSYQLGGGEISLDKVYSEWLKVDRREKITD